MEMGYKRLRRGWTGPIGANNPWIGAAVLLAGVVLGWPTVVRAQGVSFSASVDRTEVGLDERITLTLSVSVSNENQIEELKLPNTGTLNLVGKNEETSLAFSFSGGNQDFKKIKNTVLVLRPTREGSTTIGPASLRYQGKTYTTDPISVRVVKASSRPQPQKPPRRSPFGTSPFFAGDDDSFFRSPFDDILRPRPAIGENDVFIEAFLSPETVVEGQQTTVTLIVYTRLSARVAGIRWPKLNGFFSVDRDVSDARVDQKFMNGAQYRFKVLEQKALFPLQAGEVTIGPVEVEVELSGSPFFPGERRALRTRPLKVQVKELPKEGRPEGFHKANVGNFSLSASVDSREVNLNQPVTYSLTVRGTGNIQQIRPPELSELDRFKRFDPTVDVRAPKKGKEVKGSKTFEYVLVPLASGELNIPALAFSFYDPEEGKYRTLRTDPEIIRVAPSQSSGADVGDGGGREVNILAGAFKPIRYESSLKGYGPPFYRQPLFVPLLVAPPALYFFVLFWALARVIVNADRPRSRARRAVGRARQRLKNAGGLAASGRAADFYSEMKAALLDVVEARMGAPAQGLLLEDLRARLEADCVPRETAEAAVREIENCDFGRFAKASSRGDEMIASLERGRRVVKDLARRRVVRGAEERGA